MDNNLIKVNVMQFKKTFLNNLQNLSVKSTVITHPPNSNIKQNSSNHSNNHSPYQQSEKNHRYQSNKENQQTNSYKRQINNHKTSSRCSSVEKKKSSPLLTFHKVRKHLIQAEIQNMQKNIYNQKNPTVSQFKQPSLAHSSSVSSIQSKKTHVRFGSMVFASSDKNQIQESKKDNLLRNSKSQQKNSYFRNQSEIECMNGDGKLAVFKVLKCDSDDEQMLHYCHSCAIPLVKQGFILEQLSIYDKNEIKNSRYSNKQYKKSFSQSKGVSSDRLRMGQQIKCKVILKLNKLKSSKQQFNKLTNNAFSDLDYYYSSLIKIIQRQRQKDIDQLQRIINLIKSQPERYQSKLSSCLGTIDYLLKNPQHITPQNISDISRTIDLQVCYDQSVPEIEPHEGYNYKIQQFSYFFDKNIKLSFQPQNISYSTTKTQQDRNHPLRFSFEQALQQSRRKKINKINSELYPIQPLYQQNESQMQDSIHHSQSRNSAFRNLFPQQQQICQARHSPVFKQF